jgi:hypothetical protein
VTGLESGVQGTTLGVCVTVAEPPMLALIDVDAQQTRARGYDVSGVVTAPMDDGQTLIAMSGSSLVVSDTQQRVGLFLSGYAFPGHGHRGAEQPA